MKTTLYIFFILGLWLFISCSDDTSTTPTDNQKKIDTLTASIIGHVELEFVSNAVNLNTYPNDTSTGMLFSGTMLVSPTELYNIYLFVRIVDDSKMDYELDNFGEFTRFEKVIGATTLKTEYNRNISGSLNFILKEDKKYKANFNFSAESESGEKVEVKNGYFEYVIPD
jgi:transcription antitermination factor NusG